MSNPGPLASALLLCLDLQPPFLRAVADGERVLARCQFAVEAAAGLGMPVAFTEQVPEKLGPTDPRILGLVPQPEVHAKDAFSALEAGSAVREALTGSRSLEHLILCGVETPICVFQTAVDAIQAGIPVTVLTDGVGARREADARACLEGLSRAGAHILPAETVFYAIVRGARHPFFKRYTELVKKYA